MSEISPLRDALLDLAKRGCLDRFTVVRTRELAGAIGRSQQSASSYLMSLERDGLVERSYSGRTSKVKITGKGRKLLFDQFQEYRALFEKGPGTDRLILSGRAVSGFGEGAYYVSLGHYSRQIRDKLGFLPYTGTFNVELRPNDVPALARLSSLSGITLSGFEEGGRTFGEVVCYPCTVEGVEGAILIPKRTHYSDRIEVIAPAYLRGELGKGEGDEVTVEVRLD